MPAPRQTALQVEEAKGATEELGGALREGQRRRSESCRARSGTWLAIRDPDQDAERGEGADHEASRRLTLP